MRAFTLFVSAFALANLSQTAPLVDTELAQLDAELDAGLDVQLYAQLDAGLELEAGLPISKANAEKLAGWADRLLEIVATGVPSETKKVSHSRWIDGKASTNWEGHNQEYFEDETSYTIDRAELKKMAR